MRSRRHWLRGALLALSLAALGGCAMVKVESRHAADYIVTTRGDVLSDGRLSEAGIETLRAAGIEPKPCRKQPEACARQLTQVPALGDERRLATQSELWAAAALLAMRGHEPGRVDQALQAWLESARHAYAYLFFTERSPGERAFENRQNQVRDYYNYAVQQVIELDYRAAGGHVAVDGSQRPLEGWERRLDVAHFRLPGGGQQLEALVAASTLRFAGLRSSYRRDGFGAELVARVAASAVGDPAGLDEPAAGADARTPHARKQPGYSEMPYAPATVVLRFEGDTLQQVLASRRLTVEPYDPYRFHQVTLNGQQVPLAADFTAAYGLWLAESGFARQSLRALLGRAGGLDRAHLYLMQPYDPQRRVLLMLHGLASSPEAWVNLANEVMGDEALRQHYQIWQVYYPTNQPIALNRSEIATLVQDTLKHFDPGGQAPASHEMVLVGHSMGGVIGRLLVSSSGDEVWERLMAGRKLEGERGQRVRQRLSPLLHFQPLPEIDRAIFIAAPHRGTPLAEGRLGRFVAGLVKLPVALVQRFADVLQDLAGGEPAKGAQPLALPNSIQNLRDTDPFIRATADLPIAANVRYNSIIAKHDALPLAQSSDGLVPYASAHLDGAESERVIASGHSVQENPQAILEIRRILHEQIAGEPVERPSGR